MTCKNLNFCVLLLAVLTSFSTSCNKSVKTSNTAKSWTIEKNINYPLILKNLDSNDQSFIQHVRSDWRLHARSVATKESDMLIKLGFQPTIPNLVEMWTKSGQVKSKAEDYQLLCPLSKDGIFYYSGHESYILIKDQLVYYYTYEDNNIYLYIYVNDKKS